MSFQTVDQFEKKIANFFNSPYAIAIDSCTHAIELCLRYKNIKNKITIPQRTYISVPQSIKQSGGKLVFEDTKWKGIYQLKPYPIYDAAKRLTSGMYIKDTLMCLSFGIKKPLKIGKGGMVLTDSTEAYEALKKLRWSGRHEKTSYYEDDPEFMGYNSYITPEWAARGMMLLGVYPKHAEDQVEEPDYRDLTEFTIFNK